MAERRRNLFVTGLVIWALAGCDPASTTPDGGPAADATRGVDTGGGSADGALAGSDGRVADAGRDAGPDVDRGPGDAGAVDAGEAAPDGGAVDAIVDVGEPDGAAPDMMGAAVDAEVDAAIDMAIDAGPPPLDPPLITELAARDGAGLLDEDEEPSDWVELYNPNAVPYPLAGHHLTDDPDEPMGWRFPAVEIPALGYRVVFASGKDRAPLDGPLHADFRLAAEGEYLALTDPDGAVLDAWDGWPPQIEQATWGRPMAVERRDLDGLSRAVPLAEAAPGWTAPGFDDGGWPEVVPPLGFERADAPPVDAGADGLGPLVGDSVADWSAAGAQGANGWTYGYVDRGLGGPAPYAAEDFVAFPRDGGGHSPTDFWDGTRYVWFAGNPPWTLVGQRDMHPNGGNNGAEHWAIRRFEVPEDGAYVVEWHVHKENPNGNGVSGRVLHTSPGGTVELDAVAIAGDDAVGITRRLAVVMAAGDLLDFALDPTGPGDRRDDSSDGSASEARIWRAPDLGGLIATPVDWPAGAGGALRLAFDVPPDAAHIELGLWWDDGLAVWLDGAPVFGAGLPDPVDGAGRPLAEPAAGAQAIADRPPAEALAPVRIALAAGPGPHVVALAGLDGPVDDGRFVLGAAAREVRRSIGDEGRYLAPTPGADNSPPADIGPVISELTRDPPAMIDTPLEVVARVHPTSAPLASVRLTWRAAFDPEVTVELAADADDPTVYRATLPAEVMLPGQMVRWFVEARDAEGRTTREPPFPDPADSAQYRGTVVPDPTVVSDLPVLHWFMAQPAEADRASGGRATLWFDGELYDNVRIDLHGQSTRGFPKKSYDVDLNRDHRFRLSDDLRRMKDFNLLTTWADKSRVRNTLAYEALAAIGADHHLAFPVRVQQNRGFFAVADFVEDGDDRWIERLGYDPVGPLYKVYDGAYDANRAEKKTLREQGNGDYAAFIAGLGRPAAERRVFLYDNVDLARMANYLAGSFLHAGVDCCHKNYYLYRDATRLEWWMMTWDVDLSFGRVWTGSYFDDRMYPQNGLFLGRDVGSRNNLLLALYADPAFVEMYLRRTRSVLDAMLQPPGTAPEALVFEDRVDALTAQIGPDAVTDAERWPTWGEPQTMLEAARRLKADFLAPRRAWVYGSLVQHEPGVVLVPPEAGAVVGRFRVPVADDAELRWTAPDFDDGDWAEGPLGLGYEAAPGEYDGLIATVVRPTDVDPGATGVQVRVAFVVDDPAAVERLTLSMRYDDGFVAWINGVEVARRNVDGLPAWDAPAVNHPDNQAVAYEDFDVTGAIPALRPGLNVLAVHVVNTNPGSSDLLVQAALLDGALGGGVLPPAQPADAVVHAVDMQQPADPAEAWVAVANPEAFAVDVSGWIVRGAGIEHRFTAGTVIPAGGELFVVADSARFRARAESPTGGEGRFVQGDWRGRLVPAFGLPEVIRPDGTVIAPGGL